MGESKHTAGPWLYLDIGEVVRDDEVSPLIATVNLDGVSPEQAEADGRLIAAAPDLLEALKAARSQVLTLGGEVVEVDGKIASDAIQAAVLAVIDAAIAKAEGRT